MLVQKLEQFDKLPENIRSIISSDKGYKRLQALEREFNVDLFMIMIRVFIGEIAFDDLTAVFEKEAKLTPSQAKALSRRLDEEFFSSIKDFLQSQREKLHQKEHTEEKKESNRTDEVLEQGKPVSISSDISYQKPVSEFVFDYEDEEEIKQLKKKSKALKDSQKFYNLGKAAEDVIDESQDKVSFVSEIVNDPVIKKRMKNIIVSYFKDIRDELETRNTLIRSTKIGGLGLSEEDADAIISLIKEKQKHLDQYITELKVRDEGNVMAIDSVSAPDFERPELFPPPPLVIDEGIKEKAEIQTKDKQPKAKEQKDKELKAKQRIFSPKADTTPVSKTTFKAPQKQQHKQPSQSPVQSSEALEVKTSKDESYQTQTLQRPIKKKKDSVETIVFKPRLVGPIEELRRLSLVDFRRLSSDPKEAVKKILDRIRLLEKESFSKRALGIQAWYESEVNQLYLDLGRQALEQGIPTYEIIDQRIQNGEQTLTHDEFEAIMDLNQKFRG